MANNRRNFIRKGCPVMKPRGSVCSNRAVITMDACPKIHKHAQVIVHDGVVRGHTTVFDTGAQKLMIDRDGWDIIKSHDTWIDAQGVSM